MQWLIDGYNVMHAGGLLGPKLGREGFRRARRKFLDDISGTLRPEHAQQTTIVFDAKLPPGDLGLDASYRGLRVVFAFGDENADARIEQLIAAHSHPRSLTVVSSDRRIRQAAVRRHCRSVTALQFWELIDNLKERRAATRRASTTDTSPSAGAIEEKSAADSAFWVEVFRHIDEQPEVKEVLGQRDALLTDAEVAAIEREIAGEP